MYSSYVLIWLHRVQTLSSENFLPLGMENDIVCEKSKEQKKVGFPLATLFQEVFICMIGDSIMWNLQ